MNNQKNIAWLLLVIAACFEVGWVVGLKYATTVPEWSGTIIAIAVSFYLLIWTGSRLSVGTAYAVFVGLGTAGTVLVDTFIFAAPLEPIALLFIVTLLIGVVGLKMTTEEKKGSKEVEN
ncbi:DMT family transporter [Halalkalibacter krulwichiae]|uniref:Multidrug resistance protein YkkC n=1 Tax=Halalkalibacter krulwichiae TaxID=199441 RepID=A0A1X9MH96_9BACI|nr:multidrug efflux SMR transporter [Halalkalibacter krulwichiae]ARK32835.1 Multidrug resistance protein YkkC [Halalkalibacter krulwichiae]